MAITGGAKAQGTVEIFFRQVGLGPLNAQVNSAFKGMKGRASYYAGMIQSRIGMAFLGMSAAIAAFNVIAVKRFAEFDQAMKNTASVTGATADQMEFLKKTAYDLGKVGTASAKDVADAMYYLGSAGYNTKQIFQAIEPVMKLAVATQTDMSDVARITMQSLKAFGKGAEEATHFAQVFAAGISSTQLRMEWLGQSMKHVGPVASEMGMSIEETVATLGMLHDAGITAGMAGRQLRRILQGTLQTTPKVTKTLENLKDIGLKDIDVQALGIQQVFQNLSNAGATLADVFVLFGLRASASAAVLKRQSMTFKEYLDKVSQAQKLQEMFNKQMQGLQAQFKLLANTFNVFMMKFAESYVPIVRWFTKVLTALIDKLGELPPWVQRMLAFSSVVSALTFAFLGLAMIIGGVLTQGMLNVKLLSAILIGSFKSAIGVITRLFKFALVGLINALLSTKYSVRTLGLAFANLKKMSLATFFAKIGNSLVLLKAKIIALKASIYFELIAALLSLYTIVVLGIAVWQKWRDKIIGFLNDIKEAVTYAVDWWIKQFDKIKLPEFLQYAIDWWAERWKKGINKTKEAFTDLGKIIVNSTQTIRDATKMTWDEITEANRILLNSLGITKDNFKKLKESLVGIFGPVIDGLDEVDEKAKVTINSLDEKLTTFKDNLEKTWEDTIFDLITGAKTWLDVWHMILDDALKAFIHGFVRNMMKSWADALFQMHTMQGEAGMGFWDWAKLIGKAFGVFGGGGVAPTGAPVANTVNPPVTNGPLMLTKYQSGTDFVPADMLAYLHRGEQIVPASENKEKEKEITIINVIDPSFVPASIARNPNVIINVINDDVIMAGSTRRTFRRYLR